MKENKNQKPRHFLVFKFLGIACVVVTIIGFVLTFTGFGNFENNNFMIGSFMSTFGLFLAIVFLMIGFRPEIIKMSAKSAKYIQQQNKEDLSSIVNTSADIASEAITKTTQAIKKGIKDTMFCKHCGEEIDADSKFCNFCGRKQ